jgi:hypothetical protein
MHTKIQAGAQKWAPATGDTCYSLHYSTVHNAVDRIQLAKDEASDSMRDVEFLDPLNGYD